MYFFREHDVCVGLEHAGLAPRKRNVFEKENVGFVVVAVGTVRVCPHAVLPREVTVGEQREAGCIAVIHLIRTYVNELSLVVAAITALVVAIDGDSTGE